MSWSQSIPEQAELLAERALAHIKVLADRIGARPAGSPAERQALDYLSGLLTTWGYEVRREGVAIAAPARLSFPYLLGGAVLGIAGWVSKDFPWLALVLPFFFMGLPQWSRWWVQRRKPSHWSENLLAWYPPGEQNVPPPLLLCAHLDSAAALPLRRPAFLRLYSRTLDILQRFAWMIFALALLQTWNWQVEERLLVAVASLGSLGGLWLAALQVIPLMQKGEGVFSPGANDNASGVGVLLALAEGLAGQEPAQKSIGFLFTTAEESGLYGSREFVQSHADWAKTTAVICVDMVGSGDVLYCVAKEGVFNPFFTSSELQHALQKANPSLRPLWHTLRSGDYAAFCLAGFQAISLESGGKSLHDWSYHSVFDTAEKIDLRMLRQVLHTLLTFLAQADLQRLVDKGQDNPLGHQKEKGSDHAHNHQEQDRNGKTLKSS